MKILDFSQGTDYLGVLVFDYYSFKEHSYLSKKLLKNTSYRNIKVIYQLKIKLNKTSKFKKTRKTKK